MNQLLKKCLSITALLSVAAISADSCSTSGCGSSSSSSVNSVATRLKFRSQGRDRVIQDAGMQDLIYLPDMESWYGIFSIIPEYTQSFRSKNIANCLFGSDLVTSTSTASASTLNNCNTGCDTSSSCSSRTILVQGSDVENRSATAWFADYFYLPTDFNGSFSVKPRVSNININFDFYLGLDEWCNNMYFRMYGPVTFTRWKLGFCETDATSTSSTNEHLAGYFTPAELEASSLLSSFAAYARGETPGTVQGVEFQGLQFARMTSCTEKKTGFADLRAELGWNFWNCEDYRLGVDIEFAAPTGNKVSAVNLFAPQIGNHMWELGGGLNAYYRLWNCEDESWALDFNLDVHITHMFKANECRTFDLKNKPLSRYMLAEKFGANTQNLTGDVDGNEIAASKQFAKVFAPVANITTQEVKVSVGAQADLVAYFTMTWCGFTWDLGYNFWGRSCEKISKSDNCGNSSFAANTWGLKGTSFVYGYAIDESTTAPTFAEGTAIPLSATQSSANIYGGDDNLASIGGFPSTNANIDNDYIASAGGSEVVLASQPIGSQPTSTSIQPVFISQDDIDYCGSETRGISNKVWTYIGYTFERDCWSPYLGVGGFGEFGSNSGSSCKTETNACDDSSSSCHKCALSQWGVFVKLGVAFN